MYTQTPFIWQSIYVGDGWKAVGSNWWIARLH